MPELPEVEVLRRSLERHLIGRRIEGFEVSGFNLREPIPGEALAAHARGRRIVALRRRSKYLLIDLERGWTLVVHLGMSGRLVLEAEDAVCQAHEHLSLALDRGESLRFRDPRRFGLVLVLESDRMAEDRHFKHLGVEPLGGEFGGELLRQLAVGRRGPVKSFLMDGRIVVGIGNIYACEALFLSGIHPRRSVSRISSMRWSTLADSAIEVLRNAIGQGGTTLNDFADGEGNSGYFQVSLSAYGRQGEHCGRCAGTIRKIVQGGRSTYYCPGCQR